MHGMGQPKNIWPPRDQPEMGSAPGWGSIGQFPAGTSAKPRLRWPVTIYLAALLVAFVHEVPVRSAEYE